MRNPGAFAKVGETVGGDGEFRYQYDAHDNLVSTHLGGVRANNYWYDARNQLTNVRDDAGATIMGLAWDAQGNLATRNGRSYRLDLGNRLREVVGVESYRYDAQGRRVTAVDGSGQRTRSFYGASGQLLYETRRGQTAANHIYLGNRLLATRKGTTVTWRHVDALGSPVATTNASAAVVERQQYEPYGAALGGATDAVGYTGHVMDAVTGLAYMQQRYMDPGLGVFLSVDPVTAYSNPAGAFNRYWYANNNPYKFVDPDGREPHPAVAAWNWLNSSYEKDEASACFPHGCSTQETKSLRRSDEHRQNVNAVIAAIGGAPAAGARTAGVRGVVEVGRLSSTTAKASGPTARAVQQLAVNFGKNTNQVEHAFRHTDKLGLSRASVQNANKEHLPSVANKIPADGPMNQVVQVEGTSIQFTAFKLKDGSINVGRIHGVP